jgi:hypothetical protein
VLILALATRSAPPTAEAATPAGAVIKAAKRAGREMHGGRIDVPLVRRQMHVASVRDQFYKAVAPLCAEIGRRANSGSRRETLGTRRMLDVCWLNETIRTAAAASSLGEVAPDAAIACIDVAHRLVREMRLCGPLVGAPGTRPSISR